MSLIHRVCNSVTNIFRISLFLKGVGDDAPPIGEVITIPRIARVLQYGYCFSTFGGELICIATELVVLNVIKKTKIHLNAFVVGLYLEEHLNSLMEKQI